MSPNASWSIETITKKLHSPLLVAKFQKYFGVDLISVNHQEKKYPSPSTPDIKKSKSTQQLLIHSTSSTVNNHQHHLQTKDNKCYNSSGEENEDKINKRFTKSNNHMISHDVDDVHLSGSYQVNGSLKPDCPKGPTTLQNNETNTFRSKSIQTTACSNNRYNLRSKSSNASDTGSCDDNDSSSSGGDVIKSTSTSDDSNDGSVAYIIRNKFWFYLFSFAAGLGYEMFYASFFPFWFWNIDGAVGRRMVLLWVIVMYIGQALKDVIRWPRPASPPVVSLEPEYAVEYGMPSTHAMVGFALPFSMVIFTVNRYEYSLWAGMTVAITWCLLVCGSRLYLGMHSLLDIIAGLFLAGLLMVVLVPVVDLMDHWHLTSPFSPLVTLPVIIAMAKFYPKSDRWSPARGDTCVIMGAGAGILLGSWLNYQLGIITGPGLEPPFPIIWPEFNVLGLALLRAVIGIICILSARAAGKIVVFSIVCYLRNLDPRDPKTRIRASVEVPYKLITYIGMGLTITFLSPVVFRFLHIERPTMYTEV